jgi:hypothetical protein
MIVRYGADGKMCTIGTTLTMMFRVQCIYFKERGLSYLSKERSMLYPTSLGLSRALAYSR